MAVGMNYEDKLTLKFFENLRKFENHFSVFNLGVIHTAEIIPIWNLLVNSVSYLMHFVERALLSSNCGLCCLMSLASLDVSQIHYPPFLYLVSYL